MDISPRWAIRSAEQEHSLPAALLISEATVQFLQVHLLLATFWSLDMTERTEEQGMPLRMGKALLTKDT